MEALERLGPLHELQAEAVAAELVRRTSPGGHARRGHDDTLPSQCLAP
jgi:hypothetical protein